MTRWITPTGALLAGIFIGTWLPTPEARTAQADSAVSSPDERTAWYFYRVRWVTRTSETVTVTGNAPLVNTTSAALGSLVDTDRIESLPLLGRNTIDLTLLQPGSR